MAEAVHKPVKLELSSFKPKPPTAKITPVEEKEAAAVAKEHGFVARSAEKLDGRTLRKKGKTQMNMRVSEKVKNAFLQVSSEFADADECLAHLIELYRVAGKGKGA